MPDIFEKQDCPFCTPVYVGDPFYDPIDVNQALSQLDENCARGDYNGAVAVTEEWVKKAISGHDESGELTLRNELMGLYRNMGNKDKAVENAEAGLEIAGRICRENDVNSATVYINAATVFRAFAMADKALPLFEKAKQIFDENLEENDYRKAALYNNMALVLSDMKRFDEACDFFGKAASMMADLPGGTLQQALSLLNMAFCIEAEKGPDQGKEEISACVKRSVDALLTIPSPMAKEDRFTAERCVQFVEHFGFKEDAQLLKIRL